MKKTMVLAVAMLAITGARANAFDASSAVPIVFVHGFAGSATQYASVAKRFVSNGYPADRIRTFEYDSSDRNAATVAPVALDAFIDAVRAELHADQVYLVGHSLGTTVSNNYLAVPARAAKVARYVGVDGRDNTNPCGQTLQCMGIFRGSTGNVGGNNLYFNGTQTHVEAATSPESFAAQFRFFTGAEPATTRILPEPPGQVQIAGRAVNFPQNTGVDGATLLVWEVEAASGRRVDPEPVATLELGPTGAWGPVPINGQQHYELELLRPDSNVTLHVYLQPFLRDDFWVRLLSSAPGSAILANTVVGPNHATAVIIRNREFWTTDLKGHNDVLEIATTSASQGNQKSVNALQNVKTGGPSVANWPVGIHVHDNPADQVSSLAVLPFFAAQAFQTGVDVYMPAADPIDGTITFRSTPRADAAHVQVINVPNWASDRHRISVMFNDYVQDIDSWGECKRAKPSPCR